VVAERCDDGAEGEHVSRKSVMSTPRGQPRRRGLLRALLRVRCLRSSSPRRRGTRARSRRWTPRPRRCRREARRERTRRREPHWSAKCRVMAREHCQT
jgi:hypothetical protein